MSFCHTLREELHLPSRITILIEERGKATATHRYTQKRHQRFETGIGEVYESEQDWTISHYKLDRVILCIPEITPGAAMKPIVFQQRPP
jgi:hypothetical protein